MTDEARLAGLAGLVVGGVVPFDPGVVGVVLCAETLLLAMLPARTPMLKAAVASAAPANADVLICASTPSTPSRR